MCVCECVCVWTQTPTTWNVHSIRMLLNCWCVVQCDSSSSDFNDCVISGTPNGSCDIDRFAEIRCKSIAALLFLNIQPIHRSGLPDFRFLVLRGARIKLISNSLHNVKFYARAKHKITKLFNLTVVHWLTIKSRSVVQGSLHCINCYVYKIKSLNNKQRINKAVCCLLLYIFYMCWTISVFTLCIANRVCVWMSNGRSVQILIATISGVLFTESEMARTLISKSVSLFLVLFAIKCHTWISLHWTFELSWPFEQKAAE